MEYTYCILLENDGTYGYEILKSGKLFIRQHISPNYENVSFQDLETAKQMAKLIIEKLNIQCSSRITIEEEYELTNNIVSDERIIEMAIEFKEGQV